MANKKIEEKEFKHTKTSYSARYYSVFFWIVGAYMIYPVIDKGLSYLPDFLCGVFFKDWTVSLAFLSPIFFWQILSIIGTRNEIKLLKIKNDHLSITFFGILKEKSLKITYSEILSLEWSKDNLYHFNFTFKNGEQKLIRTEIYDREIAFEMIQEKIKFNK